MEMPSPVLIKREESNEKQLNISGELLEGGY